MKGAPRAPRPKAGCPAGASPGPAPGSACGGAGVERQRGGRQGGGSYAWPFRLSSAPRRPLLASIFCLAGRSLSVLGAGAKGAESGTGRGGCWRGRGRTAFLHQSKVMACLRSGSGRGPSGSLAPLTLPVTVHYTS